MHKLLLHVFLTAIAHGGHTLGATAHQNSLTDVNVPTQRPKPSALPKALSLSSPRAMPAAKSTPAAKSLPAPGTAVGAVSPKDGNAKATHAGIKSTTTRESEGSGAVAGNLSFGGVRPVTGNLSGGKVGPSMNCMLTATGRPATEAELRNHVGERVSCYNEEVRRAFSGTIAENELADSLMRTGKTVHPARIEGARLNGQAMPQAVAIRFDGKPTWENLGIKDPNYYIADQEILDRLGGEITTRIAADATVLAGGSIRGGGGGSGGGGGGMKNAKGGMKGGKDGMKGGKE